MEKIAVICAGNRLMLDDGVGPAVFDELSERYSFPVTVSLIDAGCMTMDLLSVVRDHDFLIVVDAIDGTGQPSGTVFRFAPEDIADHPVIQSLHDLRVIDLLNAAALLGYEAQGVCFGIQIENMSPAFVTEGLTPHVHEAVLLATEAVLAELVDHGVSFCHADGTPFVPPSATSSLASVPDAAARPSSEVEFAACEKVRKKDRHE